MTRDDSRAVRALRHLLAAALVATVVLSVLVPAGAGTAGPSDPALAPLSLGAETTTLDNGSVDMTVTLTNTGENRSSAPVVEVATVPAGWEVVDQRSENATWRSATREWLWFSVDAGGSVTATARLARTDAEPGPGPVELRAADAANDTAATTAALPTTEGGSSDDPTSDGSDEGDDESGGDDAGDGDVDGDGDDGSGPGVGLPVVPLALGATAVLAAGAAYVRYVRG